MNKQDILIDLLQTPSPSGKETAIIDKVETYLKDFVDEVKRDAYGNLIAFKRGASSKVSGSAFIPCIIQKKQ